MEEEILDVLNQSWDDSTILRRDNLLAEIILSLERMIIRFVDDEETPGSSRTMAFDMRQVASRVHLSPREHRTELSLSVGDMSVQRLQVFSQSDDIDEVLRAKKNRSCFRRSTWPITKPKKDLCCLAPVSRSIRSCCSP